MRWVWKPVLIVCVGLAALFSAVTVVQAENDIRIDIPASGTLVWARLEPPFSVPPQKPESVRVVGTDIKWKGSLNAQCSVIQRRGGGAPLPNDRLRFRYESGPYTTFTQANDWGHICVVSKGGFDANLQLALFLQDSDPPGSYDAVISFQYEAQNGKTSPPVQLNISIEISPLLQVSITSDPVELINPGLPDLEVIGQAQVQVTSSADWDWVLEISCSADFSSGSAVILPNQIQFSIDQVNWKPLTVAPQWSVVHCGNGNMSTPLTLYFKINSFLPFEAGIYDGLITLRAVSNSDVPGP